MTRRDEMELPYKDCPTCGLHWHLFAPAKIDGKEAVRCVECKAVYPLSAQAEPGHVVKPLEWRTSKGDDFCDVHYDSDAIGGSYTIEARKNGSFDLWKPNVQAGRYASLDEAKSAAQADFEQRIRSAITATAGTAEPGYVAGPTCHCHDDTARKYCLDKDSCTPMTEAQAALPAPATASAGWQPIDSAPKDEVLLYFPEYLQGYHRQCVAPLMIKVGRADAFPFRKPTHWMPLPAAPTKRSAT